MKTCRKTHWNGQVSPRARGRGVCYVGVGGAGEGRRGRRSETCMYIYIFSVRVFIYMSLPAAAAVVAIEKGLQINHAAFDCRGSRRNQPAASIRFTVHFTLLSRTNRSGFSFLSFSFFFCSLLVSRCTFSLCPFYTHTHTHRTRILYVYVLCVHS